jgi:hypothetical protein
MRHLSHTVPKVASQAFARKYIMLGRLVTHWGEIVGPELAAKTSPAGTRYIKKGKDGKPEIALEIAASNADATLLLYRTQAILEKINLIFGDSWIKTIQFVPLSRPPASKPRRTSKPLTSGEKTYLSGTLDTIADDDLKTLLQSLGQAILQDRKS